NDKKLDIGHCKVLASLRDNDKIINFANKIIEEGLTVRSLERCTLIESVETSSKTKAKIKKKTQKINEFIHLEEKLAKALGTKVQVSPKKKGWRIIIDFYNDEDLDRLVEFLNR